MSTIRTLVCASVLWGCDGPGLGSMTVPGPSRAEFDEAVLPILTRRCVDGLCHADERRPFSLFAPQHRRMSPADTHLEAPLTEEERAFDYFSTLGFVDADQPIRTSLLAKPLASGGSESHRGGRIFEAPGDPECDRIVEWLAR